MAGIPSVGLEEGVLAAGGEEPAPSWQVEVWAAPKVRTQLRFIISKGSRRNGAILNPQRARAHPKPSCSPQPRAATASSLGATGTPPAQACEAVLLQDALPFASAVSRAGASCCSRSHVACQPSLVGTVTVGQMCPAA